jgi:hypothetical protein
MSEHNTRIFFLPWAREGFRPSGPVDTLAGHVDAGLQLDVDVDIDASGASHTARTRLRVYGPGDVLGLRHREVVRVHPSPGTGDFPPNYFPYVEFDRPDLPWLFSPAAANNQGQLRPWICLIAVEKQEGVTLGPQPGSPLPVLSIEAPASASSELPDPSESWAWAHAQYLGNSADTVASSNGEEATIPDKLARFTERNLSRLVAPRNLRPQRSYWACVVPIWEPGRRVGLGQEPASSEDGPDTIEPAWGPETTNIRLPVYYHWEFATSERGDFEWLARLLEPQPLPGIGFRDIDASDPGPLELSSPQQHAVSLGGAMKTPGSEPTQHYQKKQDLTDLLNGAVAIDEPVLGPPIYGQWHARIEQIPPTGGSPPWARTISSDPGYRTAAGFGTQIVQKRQEELMASAWEQVGEVRRANQLLRHAQAAREASTKSHDALAETTEPALFAQFVAPVLPRVLSKSVGVTQQARVDQSALPAAALSGAFRRLVRPAGPIARRFLEPHRMSGATIVEALAGGELTADTGVTHPDGLVPLEEKLRKRICQRIGSGEEPDADGRFAEAMREFCTAELRDIERRVQSWELSPRLLAGTMKGYLEDLCERAIAHAKRTLERLDIGGRMANELLSHVEDTFCADTRRLLSNLHRGWKTQAVSLPRRAFRDQVVEDVRSVVDKFCKSLQQELADGGEPIESSEWENLARRSAQRIDQLCQQAQDAIDDLEEAALAGDARGVDRATGDLEARCRAIADLAETLRVQIITDSPELARIADEIRSICSQGEILLMQLEGVGLEDTSDVADGLRRLCARVRFRASNILAIAPHPTEGIDEHLTALFCSRGPDKEPPPPLDLANVQNEVTDALDPETTIARALLPRLGLTLDRGGDLLDQIMAAPEFPQPMYKELKRLSQEYLMPGVGTIPPNSIGLLETNPEFIEAFMVGLSHEMARELRWREYPTDRRGTYFHQFWDVSGLVPPPTKEEREDFEDVGYIHQWKGELGRHLRGESDDIERLVLVIKGDLLRRYPNTTIYAVRGQWHNVDGEWVRRPVEAPDPSDEQQTRFPVFRGQLDPDITFLGFELDQETAHGSVDETDGEPGWFFVLEEAPGEPQFGLDSGMDDMIGTVPDGISTSASTISKENDWNDLTWRHLVGSAAELDALSNLSVEGTRPSAGWSADSKKWGRNSAHMAGITWQRPVRLAIHADDMLGQE